MCLFHPFLMLLFVFNVVYNTMENIDACSEFVAIFYPQSAYTVDTCGFDSTVHRPLLQQTSKLQFEQIL